MEWKSLSECGFSNYEVSEFGYVRSNNNLGYKKKGTLITETKTAYYHYYTLRHDSNMWKKIRTHRLVTLAFWGPPPSNKHEVAHSDGNRYNNHYSNLRWATSKENAQDMCKHGNSLKGEKNPNTKLNQEEVNNIRLEYDGKHGSYTKMARKYNVSSNTVSYIIRSMKWAHI